MKHPLHQAEFVISAADDAQLPPPDCAEIAVAGRSNAGKSSAINVLANRSNLAYTSKLPGRTQQINFFRLRSGALLADLPGYGYAAVPKQLMRHWQAFLTRYIATRHSLVGLVLVIDARHGLSTLDQSLLALHLPSGRPVLLLATKMDKLTRSAQRDAELQVRRALEHISAAAPSSVRVVPFSATTRMGLAEAEEEIGRWLGLDEPPADEAPLERLPKRKGPTAKGSGRGTRNALGRENSLRGHPLREESGRREPSAGYDHRHRR
jgi:GTP-binding protein